MKVLLINGSAHQKGCTYTALKEVAGILEQEGIETEFLWIGAKPVAGCIGCGSCRSTGRCFVDDQVNQVVERLEELENRRDELENRLACEKLAKPKVSAEFMTFWLHRFRKLDVRQQSHRKMLIDTFINAIFLYDDKMVITFNYKEGTKTITFAELQEAISNNNGSDLDCIAAPY